ncbi:MAG: hypothetical protein KKA05_05570 [Alphaproteobacteria bacterium]|nr:hypothetical protein [Alphaproteobacteria bacterium]
MNNAEWCDQVCSSQGVPGIFSGAVWLQPRKGPDYYPNAISLTRDGQDEQYQGIESIRAQRAGDFSVKDSFDRLDLSKYGLKSLFQAQWLWRPPGVAVTTSPDSPVWTKIETTVELKEWQHARGEGDVFLPMLLSNPATSFLAARDKGQIVAGCIAYRDSRDVIGLSNFFAPSGERARYRAEAVDQLAKLTLAGPIAGYEHGEDLEGMKALGFRAVGPLRVWVPAP